MKIKYDKKVRKQSDHLDDYKAAIDELNRLGIIYPCFCSRSDIKAEIMRAGNAPHEEENLFYDDYIASKEKLNYYNCIFIPSLKLKDARIIL